jgi:hypothetical protein
VNIKDRLNDHPLILVVAQDDAAMGVGRMGDSLNGIDQVSVRQRLKNDISLLWRVAKIIVENRRPVHQERALLAIKVS